jgi:hypothetical protein
MKIRTKYKRARSPPKAHDIALFSLVVAVRHDALRGVVAGKPQSTISVVGCHHPDWMKPIRAVRLSIQAAEPRAAAYAARAACASATGGRGWRASTKTAGRRTVDIGQATVKVLREQRLARTNTEESLLSRALFPGPSMMGGDGLEPPTPCV